MARARRVENGRSSSTIKRLLSARSSNAAGASAIRISPCILRTFLHETSLSGSLTHMGIVPLFFESFERTSLRRNCRTSFKRMTRPNDPRDGPRGRRSGVRQGQFGPRALDQGLGDEEAQTQSTALLAVLGPLGGAACGHVGFADPEQDIGRVTGAVIPDLDENLVRRPAGLDGHLALGKVRGVVEDVG